jgi:hypothetical protein
MKEQGDCTPIAPTLPSGEMVQLYVDHNHPLLQLKRALPWRDIEEVMVSTWRGAGKNVARSRGRPWPVSLYVPLLVLMLIKRLDCREMEAYLAENAVARVFVSQQDYPGSQLRDHASIARALAALGAQGVEAVNGLIINHAAKQGFADASRLSGDTTAQELALGYPHEAGILRGIAQRSLRALLKLKKQGVDAGNAAIEQAKEVLRSVKDYYLFAKSKEEKDESLKRIMQESEVMIREAGEVVKALGESGERVRQSAIAKLTAMKRVTEKLLPQIGYWLRTGYVASGKILHPDLTEAKAIVRNKAGKKVEFGLPYLINRLGGGYVFGKLLDKVPDESKMPLESLASYRQIFGPQATPELLSYDRGGWSAPTIKKLKKAGVKHIGITPKGQADWCVAEEVQQEVKRERSRTEGVIGTLKSEKYSFNKPPERLWEMVRAAGQRSMLSFNLNKLMRDIVAKDKQARLAQAQGAA